MKTQTSYIKTKIITGYVLLFILILVAVIFIYRQIINLTTDERPISEANRKLFIIGNTITGLYEAEALSNSFTQTGNQNLFTAYIKVIGQVEADIDSLKKLTTEAGQKSRIDTIDILLNQKMLNLEQLIRIRQTLSPEEFYNRALFSIEANRDTIQEFLNIHKKVITTQDSSFIRNQKKRKGFLGIFGKKQDSAIQVTISRQIVVDSVNTQANNNPTDSVINILKSVWTDIQQKNEDLNKRINRREYSIVVKSAAITKQLKRILSDFENEEINNSILKTEQKQQALNTSSALIAKIAIIAVLLIVLFCFLILRDISKSQRYRKELEAAKQYTDQLLQSREKMMLTVTHDIKSPLSSIIGYIELFQNTTIDQRQGYYLKNMKNSSDHILNLVTKLLDFSRLESNQVKPEEVNYNPKRLLQEIGESFIPQAKNKNLNLIIEINDDLNKEYLGDALRIRQIILNILSNAIKYTPSGNVGLKATTSIAGNEMIIKIKDTGTGMSKEEQAVIFDEFTRLSSNDKHAEGTGLGLTITLKLVKLLGGNIKTESQQGIGSCFIVTLPLKQITTAPRELNKELHILIIDDDKSQLEMTASLLKTKGITADTTTSASEVMKRLGDQSYDLLLSDIQMPETDGFQLIEQIRSSSLPTAKTLPVIALSARADMAEEDYQRAGFTAYLNKPFSPAQLFTRIAQLTGKEEKMTVSVKSEKKEKQGYYTLKNIMEFTDHDQEATTKILYSFIDETTQHISILASCNKTEDIKKVAHKMLPMFRQLEVNNIVLLLQQLEQTGEKTETIQTVIDKCRELTEKLRHDLKENQIIL